MGILARMYGCLFFIKVSEVKRDKHKIILSLLGMGVGTRKGINRFGCDYNADSFCETGRARRNKEKYA